VQDGDQHEGNRLAQVQGGAQCPIREDLAWLAEVFLDERGGSRRVAGHQRPRVSEHDRVVVHVNDPAVRRRCLRHLVGVARRGNAGADVQELPDARLPRQVTDGTAEEGAVIAYRSGIGGIAEMSPSPTSRSAAKLSFPPSK
jgi:hypothetical protein